MLGSNPRRAFFFFGVFGLFFAVAVRQLVFPSCSRPYELSMLTFDQFSVSGQESVSIPLANIEILSTAAGVTPPPWHRIDGIRYCDKRQEKKPYKRKAGLAGLCAWHIFRVGGGRALGVARTLLILRFCGYYFCIAFWYCGEEFLAVAFLDYSGVENYHYSGVSLAADESAEALLEFYDCRGQLIVEEGIASLLLYLFEAACQQGLIGNGEGQADDDDVAQRLAPDVHSLPEAVRAKQHAAVLASSHVLETFEQLASIEGSTLLQ